MISIVFLEARRDFRRELHYRFDRKYLSSPGYSHARLCFDAMICALDFYMDTARMTFDELCSYLEPTSQRPYIPEFLDYVEKFGDLRVKSWYMSVDSRQSSDLSDDNLL